MGAERNRRKDAKIEGESERENIIREQGMSVPRKSH
jgi:hypothetical protein